MTLQKQLEQMRNNGFQAVYLVQGAESYLQQVVRQFFLQEVIAPEDQELNVGLFNMENTLVQDALADAEAVPFFGDRRLVIIDRPYFLTAEKAKAKLEHDFSGLEQYLDHPILSTVLVIMAPYDKLDERKKIVKKLKKIATVIDTKTMSEKETSHYLRKKIADAGYTIEDTAFQELLVKTNAHLSQAMQELDKLWLASLDTKNITLEQVDRLVAKSLEQNIFELVEALVAKNSVRALAIYHDLLLQKEEPLKMNAILLGQMRLFLQVAYLLDQGYVEAEINRKLGVHPYRVKLAIRQVKRFPLADLERAYLSLVDTEWWMKSGQGDKVIQFELFMLKFCS